MLSACGMTASSTMKFTGNKGDRVRLLYMPNDPNPISVGETGTIVDVMPQKWGHDEYSQVFVDWDSGRRLSCVCPPDHLEIISAE